MLHLEANPQHKDVDVVIRDAFEAARRRLQDYARRQRGQVKVHNAIPPLRKDKRLSWRPKITSGVDTTARVAVAFWAGACEFKYLVAWSG
jgi:hypothetical protein